MMRNKIAGLFKVNTAGRISETIKAVFVLGQKQSLDGIHQTYMKHVSDCNFFLQ